MDNPWVSLLEAEGEATRPGIARPAEDAGGVVTLDELDRTAAVPGAEALDDVAARGQLGPGRLGTRDSMRSTIGWSRVDRVGAREA